jgi:hypothetical protein
MSTPSRHKSAGSKSIEHSLVLRSNGVKTSILFYSPRVRAPGKAKAIQSVTELHVRAVLQGVAHPAPSSPCPPAAAPPFRSPATSPSRYVRSVGPSWRTLACLQISLHPLPGSLGAWREFSWVSLKEIRHGVWA